MNEWDVGLRHWQKRVDASLDAKSRVQDFPAKGPFKRPLGTIMRRSSAVVIYWVFARKDAPAHRRQLLDSFSRSAVR
jgi:hypothetical protein